MDTAEVSGASPLRVVGFLCTALGAALLGIAALLPWASVNIGGSGFSHTAGIDAHGTDLVEGKIALAGAVIILIAVIAMRVATTPSARKAWAVAIVVVALVAGGFVIEALVSSDARIGGSVASETAQRIADASGLPLPAIEAIAKKVTNVDLDPAIYLAVLGAAVALVGGILGLMWASRSETPATPSGPGGPPSVPPAPDPRPQT